MKKINLTWYTLITIWCVVLLLFGTSYILYLIYSGLDLYNFVVVFSMSIVMVMIYILFWSLKQIEEEANEKD